jgi:hypothetical protein
MSGKFNSQWSGRKKKMKIRMPGCDFKQNCIYLLRSFKHNKGVLNHVFEITY